MTRTHIVSLVVLIVAVSAATAGSFFASSANTARTKPCFIADNAGYEISSSASADYIVRIDNAAPSPNLRIQIVDDPAAADFVLVDDNDAGDACNTANAIKSIRIDPEASKPSLTVSLSQGAADYKVYKVYVRSANYSPQDAAALFAVIWQSNRKAGLGGREFAQTH
jgi:hypothetical protein